MPKKTRKMKERAALRRAAIGQEFGEAAEMSDESRSTLAPMTRATYSAPTFDYSYIYRDLRRIAIFAIFFFAVLVALSFIIR